MTFLDAIFAALLPGWGVAVKVFSADLLTYRYCYLTELPKWILLSLDGLIVVSYVLILGCIVWIAIKLPNKRELRGYVWIVVSCGSFIFLCSATHVMEMVTVWWPFYPLSAAFRCLCAAGSVAIAVGLTSQSSHLATSLGVHLEALRLSEKQEDQMTESEAEIHAIKQSQMVIEFNIDGSILYANDNYLRAFGYTWSELVGKKHRMFVSELEGQSAEYQEFWNELRRGQFHQERFKRIGKDGRNVWVEASYNPILNSDGTVSKVLKFATDVTERVEEREALIALRKSEQLLEQTAMLAGAGGWEFDLLVNQLSWSAMTKRIVGADPGYQPVLDDAINMFVGESREQIRRVIEKAVEGKGGWDLELSVLGMDCRKMWARVVGAAEFSDGIPVRLFGVFQDVTERMQQRVALEAASERLILAAESGGIGIWEWDIVDNTLLCDALMYRLYDFNPELEGRLGFESWVRRVHPEDRLFIKPALQKALGGGAALDCHYRVIWDDGSIHDIQATAKVTLDASGRPARVVGTNRDVTDRLAEGEALKKANTRAALATKSGGIGIWDWDLKSGKVTCDDLMYRIYGLDVRLQRFEDYEVWAEHVHPDDRVRVEQALQAGITSTASYDTEYRILWGDGSLHFIKASGQVILNIAGQPERMVGTNSDITKDKVAENALQDQASLLDLSRDAIMLRDLSGTIKFWNRGAEQMYDYSKDHAIGRLSHELLVTVFPIPLEEINEELLRTGQWYGELDHTTQQGRRVLAASRWVLQGGSNGEDFGVMEVNTDITERKLAEGRLLKATRLATEANQAKSEFLANMSHEIRTPMNAIMGMTYLALAAHPDPKQQVYLSKISNAADALISIINDILDFSKMEASKMELEQMPFLLKDVLDHVRDLTLQKAEEKKIALVFQEVEQETQYLLGDPGRLGQILINLVSNAVKFTLAGSVVIRAFAEEASGESMQVSFSVADTGIGISAEQLSKLFHSFAQADSSVTRKYGGTGLGLAISKQLCNLMGGTLAVMSSLGQGSTFSFKIVFEKATRPDAFQRSPGLEVLTDKSVLVVDDSEHAREVLVYMLRENGFLAESVSGSEEALSLLTTASEAGKPFDVALVNWRMPGKNGMELAHEIKRCLRLSHIPAVVMISAFDRSAVMAHVNGLEVEGFLIKPVSESSLLHTISTIFAVEANVFGTAVKTGSISDLAALEERRILLVEDNEINADLATSLLEHLGIQVTVVVNGQQGVEQVEAEAFDLVLMDIQMPVMDGLTATKLIRSNLRFRSLPIIAMTAHAMSGDRERSLSAGMNDHLTKPINPKLLTEVLLRHMPMPRAALATSGASLEINVSSLSELPDQLPPFDLAAALARAMGDPKLLRKMILKFCNQYADAVGVLRAHIAKGRREEAVRLAHSLKSVAATLEAKDLASVASKLEQALSTLQEAGLDTLLDALEEALTPAIKAAATLDRLAASLREPAESLGTPAKLRPRILVVDDEPIIIDLLNEIFAIDYEVFSATDGLEALRIAESKAPELILLDVIMPGIDGYEVCRRLRADPLTNSIPVIFVSGVGDAPSEAKGVGLGAVDYITKPFNFSVVKARVDNQITLKWKRERVARMAAEEHMLQLDAEIRRSAARQESNRQEMKLKEDFLSHVSHELRSPLASISSFSSIIADGLAGEITPEQKEYLAIIMRNVEHLRAMVEDLLDVTQARTGKLSVEMQRIDLRAAVLDAFHTLQGGADAKHLHFEHEVPAGLAFVYADPTRVVQILIILLDNAIKFTPVKGEVRIRVSVFKNNPSYLLTEVSDNGCGIDPKNTHRIFEEFYQVTHTDQAGRKGLGLGLHIAKDLVIRQGGEIWLTSTTAGSKFFFTLPIYTEQVHTPPDMIVDYVNGKNTVEIPHALGD